MRRFGRTSDFIFGYAEPGQVRLASRRVLVSAVKESRRDTGEPQDVAATSNGPHGPADWSIAAACAHA